MSEEGTTVDPTKPRACPGCGRLTHFDPTNGARYLGGAVLPHDESECVRTHETPVYQGVAARVRKTAPSRRKGERRTAWRAKVGVL